MNQENDMPSLSNTFYCFSEDLARQRITTEQWKKMLLAERDRPFINGRLRQLVGRDLGAGVVELTLEPLDKP